MEKSIKTVTIGVVAVVGLIFGGLPAVIAEGTIALVYILMKNIQGANMKNLIISILTTYVIYTRFFEVKMPVIIPFLVLFIFVILLEIDALHKEARKEGTWIG